MRVEMESATPAFKGGACRGPNAHQSPSVTGSRSLEAPKFAPWDGISVPGTVIGRLNKFMGAQASADRRWPPANQDEGTFTRVSGDSTELDHVFRVGRRSESPAAGPPASGPGAHAA